MTNLARRVAESHGFQNFILAVILVTAVIVGLETSETLVAHHGWLFEAVDAAVQTIFVIEIVIRLLAHWPRLGRFLHDGWNVFDLAVVAASLATRVSGDPQRVFLTVVAAVVVASVLTGVVCLLLGAFRLGNIVRFDRDRVHPESLPLEAVDVLRRIIDGETSEVVDRALSDLLGL